MTEIIPAWSGDTGLEGSALHWEIAWRLVRELGASQPDGGLSTDPLIMAYKLNAAVRWIADWAVSIVREEVPMDYVLEVENELSWDFGDFILTGHEDVTATSPGGNSGMDWDWKTGRIPVDQADCNEQVAGYAALRRLIYGVDQLRFEITQPWNDEDEGFPRRSVVELEGAQLDANVARLTDRIRAALADPMRLETGIAPCKYCVGMKCPAIQAEHEAMQLILTPEKLANLKNCTDSELVDLAVRAKTLKKPIEDVEDQLKERVKAVGRIQGSVHEASLKESGGGFGVVDPVGLLAGLRETISDDQLAPALTYPSGRIKDVLAKALDIPKGGKSGNSADDVFRARFGKFLEEKTRRQLIIR